MVVKISTMSFTDLDLWRKMIFLSKFWPLLNKASLLEVAGAVARIGLILKSNHQIGKFSLPKSVKHTVLQGFPFATRALERFYSFQFLAVGMHPLLHVRRLARCHTPMSQLQNDLRNQERRILMTMTSLDSVRMMTSLDTNNFDLTGF